MLQFFCIKEYRLIIILFRAIHFHCHILRNKVGFHCVFQRLMNNSVIVNDRVWFDCFQLFGIELLNVSCLQALKRYRFLTKIRLNHRFHHLLVRAECGCLNTHLDDVQPFEQIVCKRHIGSKLADFLRRYKFTSDSCKFGFGFALVALFGQSRGKVFHTAFSVVVIVA